MVYAKVGTAAYKAANYGKKKYYSGKKAYKSGRKFYRTEKHFWTGGGGSNRGSYPSYPKQDNTFLYIAGAAIVYLLYQKKKDDASDDLKESIADLVDDVRGINLKDTGAAVSNAGWDFGTSVLEGHYDFMTGMWGTTLDNVVDTVKWGYEKNYEIVKDVANSYVDKVTEVRDEGIDDAKDFFEGVWDRATADRSGDTPSRTDIVDVVNSPLKPAPVSSDKVDDAVRYVYNPGLNIIDRTIAIRPPADPSPVKSDDNRYSSGGVYLGKKPDWIK